MLLRDPRRSAQRILVVDPTRVDGVHVDSTRGVVSRRRRRHHVQGCFCHVCVRVIRGLVPVKLALHGRHVDHEGSAGRAVCVFARAHGRRLLHQRAELPVEHERRRRVDRENLQQLRCLNLPEPHGPAVLIAQIHLLTVDVEDPRGELLGAGGRVRLDELQLGRSRGRRHPPGALIQPHAVLAPPSRRVRLSFDTRVAVPFDPDAHAGEEPRGSPAARPQVTPRALRLRLQQVRVIRRGPSNGLARVVHDDVQPRQRARQVRAQPLQSRQVPQVHGHHRQPIEPVPGVGFLLESTPRVHREPRRRHHRRPAS